MDDKISEMLCLSNKWRDHYEKSITECAFKMNLTKPEADVILFLANNPDYYVSKDIVLYRGLSKSYVSKALTLLKEKGYISFSNDVSDRRYQKISLNDSVLEKVKQLQKVQKRAIHFLKDGITTEEIKIFHNVLDKILDNLRKLEEGEKNDSII